RRAHNKKRSVMASVGRGGMGGMGGGRGGGRGGGMGRGFGGHMGRGFGGHMGRFHDRRRFFNFGGFGGFFPWSWNWWWLYQQQLAQQQLAYLQAIQQAGHVTDGSELQELQNAIQMLTQQLSDIQNHLAQLQAQRSQQATMDFIEKNRAAMAASPQTMGY